MSAVSDFTLAGLPIVLLWNVRFAFWKKFWIGVMMGLGAIAVVATLIRLRFIESLVIKKDFLCTYGPHKAWAELTQFRSHIRSSYLVYC